MVDIIRLLPDHVANQIAAGEVVQRPASVVKELLENAVDAQAKKIKLILKDAGKTLIQVIDDGSGMSLTDARMAFERHATSKISKAEDLFDLHTKGFRGEALASIAAVAQVTMKTKREKDEIGTQLEIQANKVQSQQPEVCQTGTLISVKNLFFNVPARRNFLKSDQVELKNCIDEFQRVALVHPSISFELEHNGQLLFNLPQGNLRQRIVGVFGNKINEYLIPIEEQTEIISVQGFITKPEYAKKSKSAQFLFVNDRYFKHAYFHHSIAQAYEGLINDSFQPGYFLYFKVKASALDVNIHPTKTEIKFEDEAHIYAILRTAVKHALGQFSVSTALDFDLDPRLTPTSKAQKLVTAPKISVDRNFNPFKEAQSAGMKSNSASWEALYADLPEVENDETSEMHSEIPGLKSEATVKAVFFQIAGKYLCSSSPSGIVCIDQHRAHSRVLYEKFLNQSTPKESCQQLLFPLKLNFTVADIQAIGTFEKELNAAGFYFKDVATNYVELTGIPPGLEQQEVHNVLEASLIALQEEVPEEAYSKSDYLLRVLASQMAVKSGRNFKEQEIQVLFDQLFGCKEPQISPFYKKTFIKIDEAFLNTKF